MSNESAQQSSLASAMQAAGTGPSGVVDDNNMVASRQTLELPGNDEDDAPLPPHQIAAMYEQSNGGKKIEIPEDDDEEAPRPLQSIIEEEGASKEEAELTPKCRGVSQEDPSVFRQ